MTDNSEAPEDKTFAQATCLYRAVKGSDEPEARVFQKGAELPAKSEGWVDHPSLVKRA